MTLPRKRNINATLISLLLVGSYFYLWNHYALNIPKWDDHAFKATIENFEKADGVGAKLYELFRQHNEHRVGLTRLVALLDFGLFGQLNYKHLMLFGNLALLLIGWLFVRFFKATIAPVWYALPVLSLWFSLAFWENTFWGMAAVQNFWVLAFAMLVCWLLAQNNRHWGWALLAGFGATFTSGNGLLVWPIGLTILLLQRNWRPAGVWALAAALTIALYFYQYQSPPYNPAPTGGVRVLWRGFVLFCGSMGEGLPIGNVPIQMPIWVGGLSLFVSFWLVVFLVRSYWKRHFVLSPNDYFYLGCVLFVVITAAVVTYGRAGFGGGVLLTSRYKIYSALLLGLNVAYLTLLVGEKFREVLHVTWLVAATFLYVSNQHYHLYDAIQLRKFMVTSAFNNHDAKGVLLNQKPIYERPALFTDQLPALPKDSPQAKFCILKNNSLSLFRGDFRLRDLRDGGLYLYLHNDSAQYLFPTDQARKHSFRNLFNYNRFFIKGSTVRVAAADVKAGTYQLKWLRYSAPTLRWETAECGQATFGAVKKEVIKTNW